MTHFISTVLVFQLVLVDVVRLFVCLFFVLHSALLDLKYPRFSVLCSFKLKVFFLPLNKIGKRAFLCQPQTSIDVTKLLNMFTPIM